MSTYPKPPLGVSPHWFVHRKRIEELNEAISRYLEYAKESQKAVESSYLLIANWAKEIQCLALLEADLYGTPKERGGD